MRSLLCPSAIQLNDVSVDAALYGCANVHSRHSWHMHHVAHAAAAQCAIQPTLQALACLPHLTTHIRYVPQSKPSSQFTCSHQLVCCWNVFPCAHYRCDVRAKNHIVCARARTRACGGSGSGDAGIRYAQCNTQRPALFPTRAHACQTTTPSCRAARHEARPAPRLHKPSALTTMVLAGPHPPPILWLAHLRAGRPLHL